MTEWMCSEVVNRECISAAIVKKSGMVRKQAFFIDPFFFMVSSCRQYKVNSGAEVRGNQPQQMNKPRAVRCRATIQTVSAL